MVGVEVWALIVASAFIPPLVFLAYVRHQEKTRREPWGAILGAFLFGAVISVLFAIGLESLFDTSGQREYELLRGRLSVPAIVVLVVVIAPLVEEFTKGLGVRTARARIFEPEDGIVYGAAAGFGFSATENLLYEYQALVVGGQDAALWTAVIRTFTATFLHATATGILGFGMGKRYRLGGGISTILPYYAVAVLLHAAFNLVAVLDLRIAAGLTIIIAFMAIRYTVTKIRTLDAQSALEGSPRP